MVQGRDERKRETKAGKHHRATQTQGKNREIEKPREKEGEQEEGKEARLKIDKRNLPQAAAAAARRLQGGATHLSHSLLFSLSLSSFPFIHTHFIQSIYSLQHTSTHPSFLPSALLQIICTS